MVKILSITNIVGSSLTRYSDHVIVTQAGPEIGVASTKAFTTQLVALMMLVILVGRRNGLHPEMEKILAENKKDLDKPIRATVKWHASCRLFTRT